MRWIGIAATVDNEIIAANEDFALLNEASELDFDVIVKIYSTSETEYNSLKAGDLDFKIKFNTLRSTSLIPHSKSPRATMLTEIYKRRIPHMNALRGRLENALNKHRPLLGMQDFMYREKIDEAYKILRGDPFPVRQDGYLYDYANEMKLDIRVAANLVLEKYRGQQEYLRKIELLRTRHFGALKRAKTAKDFDKVSWEIDKDFFINMLL